MNLFRKDRDRMTWIFASGNMQHYLISLHPENGAIGGKENVK
jgi:hypothetical protein